MVGKVSFLARLTGDGWMDFDTRFHESDEVVTCGYFTSAVHEMREEDLIRWVLRCHFHVVSIMIDGPDCLDGGDGTWWGWAE